MHHTLRPLGETETMYAGRVPCPAPGHTVLGSRAGSSFPTSQSAAQCVTSPDVSQELDPLLCQQVGLRFGNDRLPTGRVQSIWHRNESRRRALIDYVQCQNEGSRNARIS